jgi:hypothetical protein
VKVMFEKLVYTSILGTRDQIKVSATYTEEDSQSLSIPISAFNSN